VSNQSSSNSAISASDWRKIRALLHEVTNEVESKKVDKLDNTLMSLTTQVFILNRDLKGLKLAHNQEKGRRKRGKNIFEQLRAQDGQGGLFWSPQKVKTAVKLSDDKEDAKAMVEASKQLAKEEKQQKKLA
jgi:hypothetical protein